MINNIHEKISPFWLVKSSAVFFLRQCRKELIQCKKRKQTKHFDWSMIRETHRWPIKSFVFKSSARPGWRNWWCNFSLIVWYACVPSAQPSQNFSYRYILITNHMIFLVQFGEKALQAHAILLVFEKFTRTYLFQIIALEIMWLPIQR